MSYPGDLGEISGTQGGIHGFRNDSPTPAAMLILFSPRIAREAYAEHDQTMVEDG